MRDFYEGRGRARQGSIFAVYETKLAFELQVFDRDQAQAPGLYVFLSKAGADDRSAKPAGDELLDQRDAAELHGNPQPVAKWIEHPLQRLACRSRFGKDERHVRRFCQRYYFFAS